MSRRDLLHRRCWAHALELGLDLCEPADGPDRVDPEEVDLFIDASGAVSRGRVTAEELRHFAGIATLLLRKDVEEIRHVRRIVAGRGHHLSARDVGLLLGRAAELEKQRIQAEAAERGDPLLRGRVVLTHQAAQEPEPRLGDVRLRRLARAVAQSDVRNLVSHDSGQLAFVLRCLDEAAIHVQISARQRKRVDVGGVDDLELVGVVRSGSDLR